MKLINLILDTNIFNRILDNKFALSTFPNDSIFVATNIQLCELKNTPNLARRDELVKTFQNIAPELASAAFSFDIPGAGWDEGSWSDSIHSTNIYADLQAKKIKNNNWQDALIAEVALNNNYILVTADDDLANVSESHGITVHRVI